MQDAAKFSKNFIGSFCPDERLGIAVVIGDVALDGFFDMAEKALTAEIREISLQESRHNRSDRVVVLS